MHPEKRVLIVYLPVRNLVSLGTLLLMGTLFSINMFIKEIRLNGLQSLQAQVPRIMWLADGDFVMCYIVRMSRLIA